ncbi:MAG: YdcH family protein [Proteobacteria bacterium]|nr:YdcH family protein [Pseudomonadota bacterium]
MSTVDHIEALKAKHASLEHAIDEESARPYPDDDAICSLKKRKLQIKDEISRLNAEQAKPH